MLALWRCFVNWTYVYTNLCWLDSIHFEHLFEPIYFIVWISLRISSRSINIVRWMCSVQCITSKTTSILHSYRFVGNIYIFPVTWRWMQMYIWSINGKENAFWPLRSYVLWITFKHVYLICLHFKYAHSTYLKLIHFVSKKRKKYRTSDAHNFFWMYSYSLSKNSSYISSIQVETDFNHTILI